MLTKTKQPKAIGAHLSKVQVIGLLQDALELLRKAGCESGHQVMEISHALYGCHDECDHE